MGFKDFQEIVQWLGTPIVNYDDKLLNAILTETVDRPVGNFRSLLIAARPDPVGPSNLQIQIDHRPKAAPLGLLTSSIFDFQGNKANAFVLPIYGDIITDITYRPQVAGRLHDIFIAPTNQEGHIGIGLERLILLAVLNQVVPAGGFASFTTTREYMGRAIFNYSCFVPGGGVAAPMNTVALRAWDYLNNIYAEFYRREAIAGDTAPVVLPASKVDMLFVNNTAANINISATLMVEGR